MEVLLWALAWWGVGILGVGALEVYENTRGDTSYSINMIIVLFIMSIFGPISVIALLMTGVILFLIDLINNKGSKVLFTIKKRGT